MAVIVLYIILIVYLMYNLCSICFQIFTIFQFDNLFNINAFVCKCSKTWFHMFVLSIASFSVIPDQTCFFMSMGQLCGMHCLNTVGILLSYARGLVYMRKCKHYCFLSIYCIHFWLSLIIDIRLHCSWRWLECYVHWFWNI